MDIVGDICKYKSFIYYDYRLSSFDPWSHQIIPDKNQLAKAGSFYSGFGDKVVCFSCNTKFYSWEKTDNRWIEHYKNLPNCLFIKLVGYKTENCESMDIIPSKPSRQYIFVAPQLSLKGANPLFSTYTKDTEITSLQHMCCLWIHFSTLFMQNQCIISYQLLLKKTAIYAKLIISRNFNTLVSCMIKRNLFTCTLMILYLLTKRTASCFLGVRLLIRWKYLQN